MKVSLGSLFSLTLAVAVCVSLWIWNSSRLLIYPIPRPNSLAYSTVEAARLLPHFLNASVGLDQSDRLIRDWVGPTQSIHVHIQHDGIIRSKCVGVDGWLAMGEDFAYMGAEKLGLDGLDAAMHTEIRLGNELSVLLTSDTDGWHETYKRKVIDKLFVPDVQIYVVKQNGK